MKINKLIILVLVFTPISYGQNASIINLLDKLDELDRIDFLDTLDAAKTCANNEDFVCSAKKIKEAKRYMNDTSDTKAIATTQAYINAKISARDERLRREAEARARAEAEARAAANSSNSNSSTSGCKVVSIQNDGHDGDFIKFNINANQDGSSRFISYVALYSDGNNNDPDNSNPHYRFGKPAGMFSLSWLSDGFWVPNNGDVYGKGLLGGYKIQNGVGSLEEAIKVYIEDGKYCP